MLNFSLVNSLKNSISTCSSLLLNLVSTLRNSKLGSKTEMCTVPVSSMGTINTIINTINKSFRWIFRGTVILYFLINYFYCKR